MRRTTKTGAVVAASRSFWPRAAAATTAHPRRRDHPGLDCRPSTFTIWADELRQHAKAIEPLVREVAEANGVTCEVVEVRRSATI